MALPLFFPIPKNVETLPEGGESLRAWCDAAGVVCRASGAWVERRVIGMPSIEPAIRRVPLNGAVEIGVPAHHAKSRQSIARYVLGAMAFAIFDHVARETIRGREWSKIEAPRGRRKSGVAQSNRLRQANFRRRQRLERNQDQC